MLTDVGGLALSLVAATLALRPPTARRTWGFARAEVLSAATQAGILLAIGVLALVEGTRRLVEPPDLSSGPLLLFGRSEEHTSELQSIMRISYSVFRLKK